MFRIKANTDRPEREDPEARYAWMPEAVELVWNVKGDSLLAVFGRKIRISSLGLEVLMHV